MNEPSVFEFNPEVSPAGQKAFVRYRLISVAGLIIAILAAALLAA